MQPELGSKTCNDIVNLWVCGKPYSRTVQMEQFFLLYCLWSQRSPNIWVCGWNPLVWPFKWNSTLLWYCLHYNDVHRGPNFCVLVEILECDHSNKSYWVVLSCGSSVQGDSHFVVGQGTKKCSSGNQVFSRWETSVFFVIYYVSRVRNQ